MVCVKSGKQAERGAGVSAGTALAPEIGHPLLVPPECRTFLRGTSLHSSNLLTQNNYILKIPVYGAGQHQEVYGLDTA